MTVSAERRDAGFEIVQFAWPGFVGREHARVRVVTGDGAVAQEWVETSPSLFTPVRWLAVPFAGSPAPGASPDQRRSRARRAEPARGRRAASCGASLLPDVQPRNRVTDSIAEPSAGQAPQLSIASLLKRAKPV